MILEGSEICTFLVDERLVSTRRSETLAPQAGGPASTTSDFSFVGGLRAVTATELFLFTPGRVSLFVSRADCAAVLGRNRALRWPAAAPPLTACRERAALRGLAPGSEAAARFRHETRLRSA